MDDTSEFESAELLKGAVAGAIGVWAMDRVDWAAYRAESARTRMQTVYARPGGMDPAHVTADVVLRTFGWTTPFPPQQNFAGLMVHYSFGILPGALYAAFRPRAPWLSSGGGALFGLALFLLEDELLTPLLGIAAPPQRYPWTAHARGLLAHVVYGVTTHNAMRLLDRAFPPARTRVSRTAASPRTLPRTELPTSVTEPVLSTLPFGS